MRLRWVLVSGLCGVFDLIMKGEMKELVIKGFFHGVECL